VRSSTSPLSRPSAFASSCIPNLSFKSRESKFEVLSLDQVNLVEHGRVGFVLVYGVGFEVCV